MKVIFDKLGISENVPVRGEVAEWREAVVLRV